MKNWTRRWSILGFSIVILPMVGGCLKGHSSSPEPIPVVTASAAAAEVTNTHAPASETAPVQADAESTVDETPTNDIATAEIRQVSTERGLPAGVKPGPALMEVIRLADSGVDQGVMLAYVTNSPHTFNLGAEEIIYLNDIGVPGPVVTAMIQHDQEFKAGPTYDWAVTNAPPSEEASATAPQPAASDVAPQEVPPAAATTETAPPPPTTTPTQAYFYQELSPYGSWVDVDGYGLCWQPTVVVANPSWTPYCDSGRWIYTDSGWYWYSSYSWGWAPFHYGRWFRHASAGWCWMPGYVWGPSWVTWRYNSGYCGWAPLPPAAVWSPGVGFTYYGASVGVSFSFGLGVGCYSFVPWNHFHSHGLHYYRVPHDKVDHVYRTSVTVTKIEGNRHMVSNHGISPTRVSQATRTEVKPVAIREGNTLPGRGLRPERLSSDNKTLTVYRPRVPEPVKTARVADPPVTKVEPRRLVAGSTSPSAVGASRGERPNNRTMTLDRQASRNLRPAPGSPPTAAVEPSAPSRPQPTRPASGLSNDTGTSGTANHNTASRLEPSRSPIARSAVSSSPASPAQVPSRQVQNAPQNSTPARSVWNNARPAEPSSRPQVNRAWQNDRPSPQTTAPRASAPHDNAIAPLAAQNQAPHIRQVPTYQAPSRPAPVEVPRYNPAPPSQSYSQPIQRPTAASPAYQAPSRPVEVPRYTPTPVEAPKYSAPAPRQDVSPGNQAPASRFNPSSAPSAPPAYSAPRAESPRFEPATRPAQSSGAPDAGTRAGRSGRER